MTLQLLTNRGTRSAAAINGEFKYYKTPSKGVVRASDASGTIVQLGAEAVSQWRIGDRVFGTMRPSHLNGPTQPEHIADGIGIPQPGVLTEYRVFPAAGLLAVPDYMTLDEASTMPIAAVAV